MTREPKNDAQTYWSGNFQYATPAGRRPAVKRGLIRKLMDLLGD